MQVHGPVGQVALVGGPADGGLAVLTLAGVDGTGHTPGHLLPGDDLPGRAGGGRAPAPLDSAAHPTDVVGVVSALQTNIPLHT